MAAVAEVEEELVLAVGGGAPGDGGCPGDAIAVPLRVFHPSGTQFIRVNGAVEGPVDEVVGREDDDGLDAAIAVLALLAAGNELLAVVSAIDIKTAVIFESCGVGTKDAGTDGIAVGNPFETCC